MGATKAQAPLARTFFLAMLAGLFIGLGGMFMLLVKSDATLGFAASSLLGGLAFSLGLFAVFVAGAELFTGNNLMILGTLAGKYGLVDLLRSWAIVYVGNLCGSLLLVALLAVANFAGVNGGALGTTMISVAAGKCALPWVTAFGRGILCNVLVCLAVWMSFAARTVVDKFFCAAVPVCAFVACGFEHCVANMFFIPMGMIARALGSVPPDGANLTALSPAGCASNLSAATLGNIVGEPSYLRACIGSRISAKLSGARERALQAFALFVTFVMIFDLAIPSTSYSEADSSSASVIQNQSSVAAAQDATTSSEQSTAEQVSASVKDESSSGAQEESASTESAVQESDASSQSSVSDSSQELSVASPSSTSEELRT